MKTTFIVSLVFLVLQSTAYRIPPAERAYTRAVRPNHATTATSTNGYCFIPPLPVQLAEGSLTAVLAALEGNISSVWASSNPAGVPGSLSVNLIYDQDVIWSKGFGEKNHSNPAAGPPDENTAYRIGSISKVFTTMQALRMRDEDGLDLDSELAHLLPGFGVVNPFQTGRGITLRQLASHMAGLSREAPCADMYNSDCATPESMILERLRSLPLVRPPGLKPSYSNLGFALLGVAEAHITNRSWVDLVDTMSLDLGLKNTHASIPARPADNIAEGYMADGSLARWVDIGFEAPAGQMFSSTHDLAQLIKMVFRTSATRNPAAGQILDGETLREWMHPVYMTSDLNGFGLAWELFQGGPYNFRSKDGAINGYRSIMLFVPEIRVGAVALLGNENSPLLNTAAQYLIEAVLGISAVMEQHQPAPRLPPSPTDYVGVYVHKSDVSDLQGVANVSLVTGEHGEQVLLLTGIGEGGVLVWQADDTFQLTDRYTPHYCAAESSGSDDFYVVFTRDAGKKVISATAPGFLYEYVLNKVV
ncbi:putative beta-lactamase-like 1 [Sycon ciliatum]|uniref:putative beta-lactamase-like 1 n=1 Tax=Sycon ciliatum TaxID=27933 RepID=UPI0031F66064